MALVCPVGHPPGVGTSFCRLCGRTYVEIEDVQAPAALALIGAGPVAHVESPAPVLPGVPVGPPPTQVVAAVPAGRPVAPPPAPSGPPAQAAPAPAGPPAQAPIAAPSSQAAPAPAAAPVPAPQASAAPSVLTPVLATGGVQVHLPLVPAQPVHSATAAPEAPAEAPAEAEADPAPAKKPWPWAKADQSAAEDEAAKASVAKADKPKWRKAKAEHVADEVAEVEPKAPRLPIDRTVLLVGTVAGFIGGGVSGAAVTLLLS